MISRGYDACDIGVIAKVFTNCTLFRGQPMWSGDKSLQVTDIIDDSLVCECGALFEAKRVQIVDKCT